MKVICIKDYSENNHVLYKQGEEYEMEIRYPHGLPKHHGIRNISSTETEYRVWGTNQPYCDFTRSGFTTHFKSIKYNRKNVIGKLLK